MGRDRPPGQQEQRYQTDPSRLTSPRSAQGEPFLDRIEEDRSTTPLSKGYGAECERAREDLEVAQRQLHDYQARVGQAFTQERYLAELTALRDKLKLGLSEAGTKEGEPTVAELAEQIKLLKSENAADVTPQRTETRKISAEEPVTARILRREQPGEWDRRVSDGEERKTERG